MSDQRHCPDCGAELPGAGPAGGICPRCLLVLGLNVHSDRTGISPNAELPADDFPTPGQHFRVYRIIRLLGQGGMGLVYLAEQEQPVRREVAIKIIKLGMDTREVVARFEAESQALALMNHPNIARVFAAGSTERGRPYFVMEYVPGIPITDYCDQYRLSSRARLELFCEVCQAIHHAHQKGVIHRDIKPSNILVEVLDGKPTPKVIDFGVAKAVGNRLTEETLFTQMGVLVGTPAYMSPEQAGTTGLDLDTTTDVYSLGVVLYELLVGALPFDSGDLRRAGYRELCRVIQEEEPPKPTTKLESLGAKAAEIAKRRHTEMRTLVRDVRGDLEWITMKALEKDRTRRYASASEFAADVMRHLRDEPVQASPPSALYRVRKFLRKHRAGVTAIAALVLVSLAGAAISTALFFNAQSERREAQWQSYVANIAAADAHISAGKLVDAEPRLEKCEPSLRGWEWRYLWARSAASIATLFPSGQVRSVGFSRNGAQILLASGDRVEVWNASTFMPVATYRGLGSVLGMSRDGTRVLTAGDWATGVPLQVREPASGKVIVTLLAPSQQGGYAMFSSDAKLVAVGFRDSGVWVWDATNGTRLATLTGQTFPLAFSEDGTLLASHTSSGGMSVWDIRAGRLLKAETAKEGGFARSAAFSSDGRRMAWGTSKSLQVWELPSGQVKLDLPWNDSYGVMALAFGPENTGLTVMGSDGLIEIRDPVSGGQLGLLAGPTLGFTVANAVVGFHPEKHLIVATNGMEPVKVWDYRKQVTHRIPLTPQRGDSVAVSPDHIALVTGGRLFLWQVGARSPLAAWDGKPGYDRVRFTPDGKLLAAVSEGNRITVWNVATEAVMTQPPGHSARIVSFTFSRDGGRLASVGEDRIANVREVKSGRLVGTITLPEIKRASFTKPETLSRIALNSDGTRVAFAYRSAPSPQLELFPAAQPQIAPRIEVHEIGTGRVVVAAEVPAARGSRSVEMDLDFSPEGKWIAARAGGSDVLLLDASTGAVVSTMTGTGAITASQFTADGTRLATTSSDRTVTVWDPVRAQSLLFLRDCALQSIDADRLVCLNAEGGVRVWDTRSRYYPGARQLAVTLLQRHFLVSEVVRQLENDKSIDEALRRAAIAEARLRHDNLGGLWRWATDVLTKPSTRRDDYQLAYDRIRVATPEGTQGFQYLSLLGWAQYRTGRYTEALANLSRKETVNPESIAVLAMTYKRLGRQKEALAQLANLKQLVPMAQEPDGILGRLMREAEALIEGSRKR